MKRAIVVGALALVSSLALPMVPASAVDGPKQEAETVCTGGAIHPEGTASNSATREIAPGTTITCSVTFAQAGTLNIYGMFYNVAWSVLVTPPAGYAAQTFTTTATTPTQTKLLGTLPYTFPAGTYSITLKQTAGGYGHPDYFQHTYTAAPTDPAPTYAAYPTTGNAIPGQWRCTPVNTTQQDCVVTVWQGTREPVITFPTTAPPVVPVDHFDPALLTEQQSLDRLSEATVAAGSVVVFSLGILVALRFRGRNA